MIATTPRAKGASVNVDKKTRGEASDEFGLDELADLLVGVEEGPAMLVLILSVLMLLLLLLLLLLSVLLEDDESEVLLDDGVVDIGSDNGALGSKPGIVPFTPWIVKRPEKAVYVPAEYLMK